MPDTATREVGMDAVSEVWTQVVSLSFIISAAIMWGIWLIERAHTYLLTLGAAAAIIALSFLAVDMPLAVNHQVAATAIAFIIGLFLLLRLRSRCFLLQQHAIVIVTISV